MRTLEETLGGRLRNGEKPVASSRERTDARLLLALFDQLPAMIAYWDRDARNVVANAAYLEWFGRDPDEMHGIHISEVLGAEVYAKNLPFIQGALAGEEQLFDRTLVDQTGRTRHTQASYVPDVVDGEVNGFFVLVTDVTPRVEAQRAADEAQSLAKLGNWELEPATGRVVWSKELFSIMGVDPGKELPTLTTLSEHLHPDDRERVLSNIDQATRSGQPYTIDYRIIRADGEEREVVSNGRPTLDSAGQVVRLTGTLQDVTEANRASRELAHINAELKRANELNADVLAMLGHDIRTPIGAIGGFLELLDDDWESLTETARRELVTRARSSTLRLQRMVGHILALAAIDSGDIQPVTETIDLASTLALIAATAGLANPPAVVIAPDSPPTVAFDGIHLEQILTNLLTNADRYGAEPIRIEVSPSPVGGVVIAVTDNGPGVSPSTAPKLFQRFARTGEHQSAAGGTGFGLYMAAQLALANNADLTYRPAGDGRPHAFVLTIVGTSPDPPRVDDTAQPAS